MRPSTRSMGGCLFVAVAGALVVIAEIVLPYSVRLVPRRGRRVVERVFRLSAPVEIKECTKKAAPVAFVIRRARSGRPNLQVRSFEGALWWPLLRLERYRMTRKECLEVLRDGSLDLFRLYWPGDVRPTCGLDDVVLRRIVSSDRDSAVADAARKAGDLLFCGNHVYRRGGEPVYIAPDGERIDVTDAACLGPAIDPRVDGWWRRFGHDRLTDLAAINAISEGKFFAATAPARELQSSGKHPDDAVDAVPHRSGQVAFRRSLPARVGNVLSWRRGDTRRAFRGPLRHQASGAEGVRNGPAGYRGMGLRAVPLRRLVRSSPGPAADCGAGLPQRR